MDHYIDICLRPDPEFPPPQLMNALFAKLHRAFVLLGSDDIGVSFPEVGQRTLTLGSHLRLHGSLTALQILQGENWMIGMRDHVQCATPIGIPTQVAHRRVVRVQAQSNPERVRRRLTRRLMNREHLGAIEAAGRIAPLAAHTLSLPYVQLRSSSTGQSFRMFIDHQPIQQRSEAGTFNVFGLSKGATVPWF